jgi:hypothetical protein
MPVTPEVGEPADDAANELGIAAPRRLGLACGAPRPHRVAGGADRRRGSRRPGPRRGGGLPELADDRRQDGDRLASRRHRRPAAGRRGARRSRAGLEQRRLPRTPRHAQRQDDRAVAPDRRQRQRRQRLHLERVRRVARREARQRSRPSRDPCLLRITRRLPFGSGAASPSQNSASPLKAGVLPSQSDVPGTANERCFSTSLPATAAPRRARRPARRRRACGGPVASSSTRARGLTHGGRLQSRRGQRRRRGTLGPAAPRHRAVGRRRADAGPCRGRLLRGAVAAERVTATLAAAIRRGSQSPGASEAGGRPCTVVRRTAQAGVRAEGRPARCGRSHSAQRTVTETAPTCSLCPGRSAVPSAPVDSSSLPEGTHTGAAFSRPSMLGR